MMKGASGIRVYAFLVFGISIVLWMMGYTSPFYATVSNMSGNIAGDLLNSFILIFTNPTFLALLGVSAVASYFSGGSNFSVTYLIPMLLVLVMLNYFLLPINFIFDMAMNPMLKVIIGGFLNLLLAFAMLEFVRGTG